MAPHPSRSLRACVLMSGLGLKAMIASSGPMDTRNFTTPQPRKEPVATVVVTEEPTPIRSRTAYKVARSGHRRSLAYTDRSAIPRMMQAFRCPPKSTEEHAFIAWLAERDALIDRALALGYVIGTLTNVISGRSFWSGLAVWKIETEDDVALETKYRTGGNVNRDAPAPENGDAILMTRGWAMLNRYDTDLRPSLLIPRWFLPEPTVG